MLKVFSGKSLDFFFVIFQPGRFDVRTNNAIETIKTDDKLLCLMLPVNSNTRFAKSTVTQGLPNTCICQVVSDVQLHCFVSTQNPNLHIK